MLLQGSWIRMQEEKLGFHRGGQEENECTENVKLFKEARKKHWSFVVDGTSSVELSKIHKATWRH